MANLKATNYEGLSALLGSSDKRKTIGNNTTAEWGVGNEIQVRLHGHLIVSLAPNGQVYVTDAGWPTVTTRERINQFLPARYYLCQRKGEQFIGDRQNDHALTFFDGERIFDASAVAA